MVAPLVLKIVAFSLAKKVVVFLVAKLYGFPRLYRRASKFNHYVNRDNPGSREKLQNQLQFMFRLPSYLYQTLNRWRGVQGPPSAPPGPSSHGATHHHSQQKQIKHCAQVREIHTRASALQVVPNPSSSLSGFGFISQSLQTHLVGWRGAGIRSTRVTRPFSVSCALLPFAVSALVLPSKQLESLQARHFMSSTGHVVQIKAASSQSGNLRYIKNSVQTCSSQGASMEHAYRSASETMAGESRNPVQKSVGLSLIL